MNYSKQRALILEAVSRPPLHPTADAIYSQLRPGSPSLSLATVYRNLNQLVLHGVLRRIAMPDGGNRFDARVDEHDHIVCMHCGSISDVERQSFLQLDAHVLRETGFLVTGHSLLISGICKTCQNKARHTMPET